MSKQKKKPKKPKKTPTLKLGLARPLIGSPNFVTLKTKLGNTPAYDDIVVDELAYQIEKFLPKFANDTARFEDIEPSVLIVLRKAFEAGERYGRHMVNDNFRGVLGEFVRELNNEAN